MQRLRTTFTRSRTPTGAEMKTQSSLEVPKQVGSRAYLCFMLLLFFFFLFSSLHIDADINIFQCAVYFLAHIHILNDRCLCLFRVYFFFSLSLSRILLLFGKYSRLIVVDICIIFYIVFLFLTSSRISMHPDYLFLEAQKS